MRPSLLRLAEHRTPLIKFLGKRTAPTANAIDHTPHQHPADPHASLPDSFAESFVKYRGRAQQHGPLIKGQSSSETGSGASGDQAGTSKPAASKAYGLIGGKAGKSLGSVQAAKGEFFDRSELPRRFRALEWEEWEIEAVSSGGASLWK